jgi:hypothetical protein
MHIFGISEQFATKKVPDDFVGQPKKAVEDLKILISCRTKVGCEKHMQLSRPRGF